MRRPEYILKEPELRTFQNNMQYSMSNEELTAWVLGVDRRLALIGSMKKHPILKASNIAQETNRSTQNISRALKEFRDKGFIKCLNPDKNTWKRYVLTDTGKEVLKNLDGRFL